MAHYQVFIPGVHATKAEAFASVGLSDIADNATSGMTVAEGPTGAAGTLYGWFTNKGGVYHKWAPDRQVSIPAIAGDELAESRYWVIIDPLKPPTPDELMRPQPYRGGSVVLGDSCRWLLPDAFDVPRTMLRMDNGETCYVPVRKLAQFHAEACHWRQMFREMDVGSAVMLSEPIMESMRDFVAMGLAANYRLIPEVADYLELWTAGSAGTVLTAALVIMAPVLATLHRGGDS